MYNQIHQIELIVRRDNVTEFLDYVIVEQVDQYIYKYLNHDQTIEKLV